MQRGQASFSEEEMNSVMDNAAVSSERYFVLYYADGSAISPALLSSAF